MNINDEDNVVYRNRILEIFSISTYDNNILTKKIKNLYAIVIEHDRIDDLLKNILKKKASVFLSDDLCIGFMLFYSFDTIDTFHSIIMTMLNGTDAEWAKKKHLLNRYDKYV
jgi:hypothetical protein